jgi:hypothetical protein
MEELMPFLLEEVLMFENCCLNTPQLGGTDVTASSQSYGFEPILALTLSSIHMDMRRLHPFIGVKMEAPIQQTKNSGHIRCGRSYVRGILHQSECQITTLLAFRLVTHAIGRGTTRLVSSL